MAYSEGVMKQEQKIKDFIQKWGYKALIKTDQKKIDKLMLQDLDKLINSKWIKCSDELPKRSIPVLIITVRSRIYIAGHNKDSKIGANGWLTDNLQFFKFEDVCYWQPLPKLPK